MILDLHRQGLSVSAIARRTGRDPKTVRKYIERGLDLRPMDHASRVRPATRPLLDYLRERMTAFPDLTGSRLTREIRERGYTGAYTAVKRFLRAIRPAAPAPSRFASRRRPASRPRSTSPASCRLHGRAGRHRGSSGCSRWCSATPALHLGPLRPASGSADAAALSHGGLRGDRRRAARDPLRPHEDGGDRRGRRGPHRLQPLAARSGPALRLPAQSLPARTGPRPRARSSGRSAISARTSSWPARFRNLDDLNAQLQDWLDTVANVRAARHDAADRLGGLCRRAARSAAAAAGTLRCRSQARTPRQPRRARLVGGNYLQRSRPHPRASSRCISLPDVIRILDERPSGRHPSGPGGPAPAPDRSGPSAGRSRAQHRRGHATTPLSIGRAGDHVARRSLAFYRRSADSWPRTGEPRMTGPRRHSATLDSIRRSLVGLRMPRALEVLDATVRRIEQGEIDGDRGARSPARRGTDPAREPPHQDRAAGWRG